MGMLTLLKHRHADFTRRHTGFGQVTDNSDVDLVTAPCRAGRTATSGRWRNPWLFDWIPQQVFAFAEEVQAKTGLPVVQIEGSTREIIFSTTGGYKIGLRIDRAGERLDLRPAWRASAPRSTL